MHFFVLLTLMSASIWNLRLRVLAHSFHDARYAFTFERETYDSWAWLALEEGLFSFSLGRGAAQICTEGGWVLCPPGVALTRQIQRVASYHFVRFEPFDERAAPLLTSFAGYGTLRDSARSKANFAALRAASFGEKNHEWRAHLLLDFLRSAFHEKQLATPIAPRDALMETAQRFIETHFAEKISLEALAQSLGLSPSAFSRRFAAGVGVSPQEFLLEIRLRAARRRLLETDETLDCLAPKCGFASGFYFSRMWTKRYGVSPARFRRLHRV